MLMLTESGAIFFLPSFIQEDAPHPHFPLLLVFGLRLRAVCICNQLLAVGVPIGSAVCVFEYMVQDSEWY